jgi:hypothetical protein
MDSLGSAVVSIVELCDVALAEFFEIDHCKFVEELRCYLPAG